jgi:hypothetical protein
MNVVELRDAEAARVFVAQSLWLQRVLKPSPATVKAALAYALEIASDGNPLPPIGFVADLAAIALGTDSQKWSKTHEDIPGWPQTLTRSYEDHLLGKLYSDWTFERASDALRRYQDRDRAKGLAYIVKQFRSRGKLGGTEVSPAVLRSMNSLNAEDLLAVGYESLSRNGPLPLLVSQYEELVRAARRMAEVLDPEDVIALEQRTALADMGEYVAHRHILQSTARYESRLPARPVHPMIGRQEVPTRVLDEDQYPVGGYTSISNRGSIESLLHSQLAYMEEDERPDLFDTKFVRDELFYYSRDENQFLRRRRMFLFVFDPSLVHARVKDAKLPFQRIVLTVAVVLAVIRRLSDWLSTDALRFELIFPTANGASPLEAEAKLFEILLSELRANGTAVVIRSGGTDGSHSNSRRNPYSELLASTDGWIDHAEKLSLTSQVQVLLLGRTPEWIERDGIVTSTLGVNSTHPKLVDGHGEVLELLGDDLIDRWTDAVLSILKLWV